MGAAINYRQQQIELRPTEADLERGLGSILSEEKWRHERAEIAREDRDRKAREAYEAYEEEQERRAEIAREDRDRKAREAYIAYEAYEEEQERRGVTEREDREQERGTLGEYYPAMAPGCWKTRMTSDWYDDDRWEKVEENYSADRRLPGQFLWNRGLVNEEYYGAGLFSSLFKSPEEQEVTFAEANRAAKIYKRRRFSGG